MVDFIRWDIFGWKVLGLAPVLIVVALWWRRAKRERNALQVADGLLSQGQFKQALEQLGKAEREWTYNVSSSTPDTVVGDTQRLSKIIDLMLDTATKCGERWNADTLSRALQERAQIYANKSNFKFGSFTLKPEFALRDNELEASIQAGREELRRRCASILGSDAP